MRINMDIVRHTKQEKIMSFEPQFSKEHLKQALFVLESSTNPNWRSVYEAYQEIKRAYEYIEKIESKCSCLQCQIKMASEPKEWR